MLNLLLIPVMLLLSVIQTVAVSRLSILSGTADIILLAIVAWGVTDEENNIFIFALSGGLFISLMTAMPTIFVMFGYIIIALITWLIHKRIWQSPILAAVISTILGTIAKFIIDMIGLQFIGVGFRMITGIREILAPSIVMNLFFLFPIYLMISDLVKWSSPKKDNES
jgi:hypothetical protein